MMGFFSNLFAKQNCAVCGKECGTMHRSKLRDGQFLCDDCGNKCSKYIRLSELTLDEAKEHMEYMARMKRVFDEVFNKTEFRVNAYPSPPTQMGLVFCDELGMLYIDDRTGGRGKMPELIRYDQIASYEEYLDETPAKEPGQEPTLNGGGLKLKLVQPRMIPIHVNGDITECQRPLRAQTAQGERVSLANSEQIPAGSTCEFEIVLLDDSHEKVVLEWLDYGALRGIGQWRNSSKGRFAYEILNSFSYYL